MAIIVIPILMFPLLFIMFPLLLESEAAELDSLQVDVVIQSNELPELLQEFNSTSISISFESLNNNTTLSYPGDDLDRLRSLSIDAVLRLDKGDIWYYAIIHISTSESSMKHVQD